MKLTLEELRRRIEDAIKHIEKNIERATSGRQILVTNRILRIRNERNPRRGLLFTLRFGQENLKTAERYFKDLGYREIERTEISGGCILVMQHPKTKDEYSIEDAICQHLEPEYRGSDLPHLYSEIENLKRGLKKPASFVLKFFEEYRGVTSYNEEFHKELLRLKEEEQ